jgi:hypothetical protein
VKRTAPRLGAALAVALLVVLLLLRGRHPTAPPREVPVTRALPVPSFQRDPGEVRRGTLVAAPAPVAIDEVTVEKAEVCEGEENLVTVKAHAAERTGEPFLHAVIAGHPGMRVVVRGNANPRVGAEAKVIVFGRDRQATTADVPPFLVKACKVDHQLFIAQRTLPNRDAEFELTARVDPFGASAPFRAARYEWEFGDGTTSVTPAPVERHDYSRRPQDRLRSELLVRVTALSASGARVEGRTTIELLNPSFESLAEKGVVKVYADLEPRFPVQGERQRVRLWHPYQSTVKIEHVRRLTLRRAAPAAAAEIEVRLPPIHPGETVEAGALSLEPGPDSRSGRASDEGDDVVGVEFYLEGKTDDGFRAAGNFALMRPPRPPTRAAHQMVSALQTARIVRARQLLGHDYVTDEDIWRLEREGKLSDLQVGPEREADPGSLPAKNLRTRVEAQAPP